MFNISVETINLKYIMATYFPYSHLILTLYNNIVPTTAASFFGEWSVGECDTTAQTPVSMAEISELYY